ncbi:MAG: glycosyltransferase family 39 protein [Candidatus Kerfeldbacteria bacterium]|nr:glycosyltransferase family 39 protein [Candidatus Kerfeldbacteria bacterium]
MKKYFRAHPVRLALIVVALLQLVYGAYFAWNDSATVDEVAHIGDGYAVVAHQDNRLNPEHPPLLKALAGMMVAAQFPNDIVGTSSWAEHNQWGAGRELLYWQDNNANWLLFAGRMPTVVASVIFCVMLFGLAREFFSMRTSLIVYGLAVLFPDVLGHGHFITTDIMAALGYTTVLWVYVRMLKKKSKKIWPLVLAMTFAQLCKFSSVLLFAIVPLIGLMWRKWSDRTSFGSAFLTTVRESASVIPLTFLLVWIVYIPVTWNMSQGLLDTLISSNLSYIDSHFYWVFNVLHALASNPFTKPLCDYVLGVAMVVLRVEGGNNTFIFGQMNMHGIWWFFPIAWLVKTPIGLIALYATGIFAAIQLRVKKEILFVAGAVLCVYWGFTLKGSLNLGTRHLLPTISSLLLIVGYAFEALWSRTRGWKIFLSAMTAWAVVSVVLNAAHPLAYMNEVSLFVPRNDILVDSSLDWGQDLKRLAAYVRKNNIDDIKVDYFGGGDTLREIPNATLWHVEYGPTTGYLAVSATFLPFSHMYGVKEGKWSYDWLKEFTPIATIGHSILVYHITEQDFIDHPPTSPYPLVQPAWIPPVQ